MTAPALGVAAAGGFAGLGLLAVVLAPARRTGRRLVLFVALVVAAGAAAGAMATAAPTGTDAFDAFWRGVAGGGVVVLATAASPLACLVAAAAGLAVATAVGSDVQWLAAAAAGGSVAVVVGAPGDRQLLAPVIGAAIGASLFHLDAFDGGVAGAGLAAFPLVPLAASAVARASGEARHRVARLALLAGTAVVLVVAGWGVAAAQARGRLLDAVESTRSALAAARGGERDRAAAGFAAAAEEFDEARRDLSSWWARPVLGLPVAGRNAKALHAMATAGARLTRTATDTVASADPASVRMTGGVVPLEKIRALEVPIQASLAALERAGETLRPARSPLLLPAVADRLESLLAHVANARRDAEVALDAVRAVPGLLGESGPRRYFLAIQTPSELRGTGGLIGNFGELVAEGGRISLTRVGRSADLNQGGDPASRRVHGEPAYVARYGGFRPQQDWRNVNMAPDFPTVARVIADLYPQSGGQHLDGVIAVDPIGLAALLRVTGPVSVPGLPGPLTADNAAKELLFDQYLRFQAPTESTRVEFLGAATVAIWERLTSSTLPGPPDLAAALGPAVTGKHLLLHSRHRGEKRFLSLAGVGGALPEAPGDMIAVINQNAGGNKLDWFLDRSIRYRAMVDPASGELRASVVVRLTNSAPASGLPPIVIDNLRGAPPGHNHTYLSVLTPWALEGATVDGREVPMESQEEPAGRYAYSRELQIPPGTTVEVVLRLQGVLAGARNYNLAVWRQPTVRPDRLDLDVELAPGWAATELRGLVPTGGASRFGMSNALDRDIVVGVGAERDG
ncbi:MAG TPA: DUF4012 domain-containing protein [Acidimicrobiales bacterium]|nr:DUF4012 domain-containing protein [Acidimicrobiales bacterium]